MNNKQLMTAVIFVLIAALLTSCSTAAGEEKATSTKADFNCGWTFVKSSAEWVRIKSLAGEPCRVKPGLDGKVRIKGNRQHKLKKVSPGVYEIDMKKGDEVLLY